MKSYKIYQLPVQNKATFMDYEFVKAHKVIPDFKDYNLVYEGEIEDYGANDVTLLEMIYHELNVNHPADYTARSLSTSDVVEINNQFYYCDAIGYVNLLNWK